MKEQREFGARSFAASKVLFDTRTQGIAYSMLYQHVMEIIDRASEGRVFVVDQLSFRAKPSYERGPRVWEVELHLLVTFDDTPS